MHTFSRKTIDLVTKENYLDRLQQIYSHEEGERDVSETTLNEIRDAFSRRNETELLNKLLGLEKFPYKDSYVAFLRKDRTAIARNPATVRRICSRLYEMGIDRVIDGVTQAKEANTRRGPQFSRWLHRQYPSLGVNEFKRSKTGIVLLNASELEAKDFCNRELKVGITKRPDLVVKVNQRYVIGESKFLSATGGNQGRGFDDGVKLASNAEGVAYKVFILDGVLWIERGSEQFQRIDNTNAAIFSALLLNEYLKQVS